MRFGFLNHVLDFALGQSTGRGDRHLLLTRGCLVARSNVQDAVGVKIEGHFDLGDTTWRGRETIEDEASQRLVVVRHRALALGDMDLNLVLVVGRGREDLALARRDRRVALDQWS